MQSLHGFFAILEICHPFRCGIYVSLSNLLIVFIMNQMLEHYYFNKIIFFDEI